MSCNVSDLIQIPFKWGGRDRTGMDCQGLFLEVMSRFGNNQIMDTSLDNFSSRRINRTILSHILSGKWSQQQIPEPGDAVAMALDPMLPHTVQHLGVYLGEGKFIHILEGTKVTISRIDDRFFKRKIKAFYRWNPNE
ncbi:MAG: NlpC/P60 family protein [Sulfuricurvum sp.]|jgi:cell wall-associated NlpC family hydrolase|nr:NlpC/P60 family protein [Sulfuricurvum sp.]